MIAAILRAQWLSIRNARGGARSAALTIFSSTLWYGFWCVLAVGAFWFTANPESRGLVEMSLPRGLGFIVLY
ncbi:MAG: hypothetical protein ACRD8O_17985, partial [Bryobacteraceae bacterium]